MKRLVSFVIILISIISLSSCKKPEKIKEDPYLDHKKVLTLISEYDVMVTNGFDYITIQKLKNSSTIVNSHSIMVRLNKENKIIGVRTEKSKKLNENIIDDQYTETTKCAYFNNNKIGVFRDNKWNWKSCSFEDFVIVNISSLNLNIDNFKDFELAEEATYNALNIKIDDTKVNTIFEGLSNAKNLAIEIKTDKDYKRLISLDISYLQKLTQISFSFVPYYENVDINIPE